MDKPTPETAKVVTADQVTIGDEVYWEKQWDDDTHRDMCWRTVLDIEEPSEKYIYDFALVLETFADEPCHFIKECDNEHLVIVRKR